MFHRLFLLELKKNLRQLPFVCIAAALLAFFIGGLVLFATRIYENDSRLLDVRMAVVSETPDDPYLDMIMGYVDAVSESSEDYTFSLSGSNFQRDRKLVMYSKHMVLTLQMMEEEQARKELQDGTSLAILYLPANLTYDILVGKETSVRIELGDVNSLDALMITEMSGALSNLLCSAQADDYSISELYERLEVKGDEGNALIKMDMINGVHVAQRGMIFYSKLITPGGLTDIDSSAVQTLIYFASCGLILLMFFSHVGFSPAISAETPVFYDILLSRHLPFGTLRYVLCKFAANLLIYGGLLTLFWIPAHILLSAATDAKIPSLGSGLALLWITVALIDAISLFLFLAFRSAPAAILTFFCGMIGMSFLSGYFIPSAYLPDLCERIGSVLPTAPLLELWNKAAGFPASDTTPVLLIWILVFLALAVTALLTGRRRRS